MFQGEPENESEGTLEGKEGKETEWPEPDVCSPPIIKNKTKLCFCAGAMNEVY